MTKRPGVSVLLPVYNAAPYAQQAVQSVLSQTFTDFELILFDDGSTDGSLPLLRQFSDARIRLFSRPNRGLVATLNEAIAQSRADLLARMDADDVAFPERFAKQVDFLGQHPACVAVGTGIVVVDPLGEPIKTPPTALGHPAIGRGLLAGNGWVLCHPTVMMRKAAVLSAGGYRAEYDRAEDLDLFLRLAEVGELANLPEPLLYFRQHFHSVCALHAETQSKLKRLVIREAYARRGIPVSDKDLQLPKEVRLSGCAQHLSWFLFALRNGRLSQARRHLRDALTHAPRDREQARALFQGVAAALSAYRSRAAAHRLAK